MESSELKQPKVDIFQTDADIRRAVQEAHDREWALCAQNFWYWVENYILTEDEERKTIRPFPGDIPYLHSLDEAVEEYHRVIVLKPRRMKVSWYGMLKQFHGAFFAGTGVPDVPQMFYGGTGSIGETEALYLMERVSKPYRLLPEWMKARNPLVRDNELIKEFAAGGKMQGFPLKRQGPQTFGFSFFFFDEMAWQEAVRGTWKGLIPTLGGEGTLLAVSTPNGKFNLFSEVWHNKDHAYDDFYRWECNWWDDPEHDERWFKNATAGLKKNEVAQMFLKSFAIPSGDPVWSEYNDDVHSVEDVEPFEGKPLFIGVDCGFHFPAISIWQRSSRDQWAGIFEHQGYSISFDDFLKAFIVQVNTVLDLKKFALIFCLPPDALQAYRTKARSGAQNDLQEIKKMFPGAQIRIGPHEVGTRTNEGPRLKEVRKLWRLRADGEPGVYFSRKMKLFREGCQGGYHYPESKNAALSEQPAESESTHLQDSFQNVVTCFNRMFQFTATPQAPRSRERIGHRTGL